MTDQFSAHDMATAAADGFRAGHLNGLAGRIMDALDVIAEAQAKGGES